MQFENMAPEGAIGAVPPAWPALLTREQVCAYVGMAADSFKRVCPVPAVALGPRLLLWRRTDIDAWVAGLPLRLTRLASQRRDETAGPVAPAQVAGDERRFSAVERAKLRAGLKRAKARAR